MDDKPEAQPEPKVEKVDLAAAVRQARLENAERAASIADLRDIEAGRLALLESALNPIFRQAPPGVDMFDLTLSQGQRPRLFLDMVAFIEMGRDSRTYRFFQDTLHGRVLIAEGQQIDRIVAAVTNYVARRLVERERTLVAESACREAAGGNGSPSEARRENAERAGPPAPERRQRAFPSASPSAEAASPAEAEALKVAIAPAPLGRRLIRGIGAALRFVVMTLGSLTLIGLLAVAGYVAWTIWLHNLLARWTGASTL